MSKIGKGQSLSDRVVALIEAAKQKVGVAVNLAQVYTNYEIGRQIVEEEQKGRRRAGYGEKIVEELSAPVTQLARLTICDALWYNAFCLV